MYRWILAATAQQVATKNRVLLLKIARVLPNAVRRRKMGSVWKVRSPVRSRARSLVPVRRRPDARSRVCSALAAADLVEVAKGANKWIRVAQGWVHILDGKRTMMDPFHL
eukprot:scaffold548185_cov39-Prasinocladus_malaysianus.AAC.1